MKRRGITRSRMFFGQRLNDQLCNIIWLASQGAHALKSPPCGIEELTIRVVGLSEISSAIICNAAELRHDEPGLYDHYPYAKSGKLSAHPIGDRFQRVLGRVVD